MIYACFVFGFLANFLSFFASIVVNGIEIEFVFQMENLLLFEFPNGRAFLKNGKNKSVIRHGKTNKCNCIHRFGFEL